jgi:predicted NAD/FAD-dependent oxidoreductase
MIMPRATAPDIAVIGGGLAGLTCATRLAEHGLHVQLYDKGRQPGGRVARRHRMGLMFEHGARGYRDLVERLADNLTVMSRTRITAITTSDNGRWRLFADSHPLRTVFGGVVLATPAPQAHELLEPVAPELAGRVASVEMRPLLSALVGLPAPAGRAVDHIRFAEGSVAEAIRLPRDDEDGAEAWVLHASADFSRDNLECDPDVVAQHLWSRFRSELALEPPPPVYLRGHRWRHALTETPLGEPFLLDEERQLGVCGDWCLGADVESALASGHALAAKILGIPERPASDVLTAREGSA